MTLNVPIRIIAASCVGVALFSGFISMMILLIGYNPRIYTEDNYQYVKATVVGYGQRNVDCTYPCNCRRVCRPAYRPPCASFHKQTICDVCRSPCILAWVKFQVDSPPFSFDAFPLLNYDPIGELQSKYPLNSTMDAYFSMSKMNIVYGDTLTTSENCFIAGFVFLGISVLSLLTLGISFILYCISKKINTSN